MAQNARPTMASPARLAKTLWLWASVWACWAPGGLCAAAIPSDLTTESYIYTGPTKGPLKPPEPPKDFEIDWETPFASSVRFIISFNATFNVSKVSLGNASERHDLFSFLCFYFQLRAVNARIKFVSIHDKTDRMKETKHKNLNKICIWFMV